jgi:hypothetical protein
MSWSARLTHTTTGLAIVFAGPVSRLDMTPDVAAHFARLLAAEAAAPQRATEGDRQTAAPDRFLPEILPIRVIDRHPICCDCDGCLNGDHHA